MKTALGTLFLIGLCTSAVAETHPVGFHTSTLPDPQRPLEMAVWYPSTSTATAQVIDNNPVFVSTSAVRDAPPTAGEHPLVVLSHGYRGNWSNQMWLANALADQGYIVAAVNHPGSTTHDRSPQAAAQLWQRPVDLRRAIEAVVAQPGKFGAVAPQRIAVVGHSLGGWTALEIAGARFDPERFAEDCKTHAQLASCSVYKQMNPASTAQAKADLAADRRYEPVTAIVSLDLGLSRGMTDASLAALPVPTLVIAAGAPSADLPAQLESADLAKRLPAATTRYVEISDATHFSFTSMCKPGAIEMLEEDAPGDGVICRDGEHARPREEIQQQVVALIGDFLVTSKP
ncbi:alpha/beta hydrolase family protein [Pseudomonas sp. NPDC087803]|uniref:alpha/beta hydrolase family protein n=1 Tax=Pseudomonas sp. NPDC087803 TaxID=3364448 RepID=UPI00381D9383